MGGTVAGGRPRPHPPTRAELARARARRRARFRRRRVAVAGGLCGIAAVALVLSSGGGGHPGGAGGARGGTRRVPAVAAHEVTVVRAQLLSWQLPSALSRQVVLPGPAGDLWVLGGLDASGATVTTSYLLAPGTGATRPATGLAEATHDAAGVLLGHGALVLGGGTSAPAGEAQMATPAGPASLVGQLPQARSDLRAVSIGRTAYLVGGYDGPSMDATVLATTNGRSYTSVATLPDPVRYPTLAVVGGDIYVFGGQGPDGAPVSTIQRVDPRRHLAQVVGHLPVATEASVAGAIGGTVYLAGGLAAGTSGAPSATGAVYAYQATHGTLVRVATLPVPIDNAGGAVLGGRLYVLGGEGVSGTPSADAQVVEVTREAPPHGASRG